MTKHAPSAQKLAKARQSGKFLQIFTIRQLLALVICLYLLERQFNWYWVGIRKLIESIVVASFQQPWDLIRELLFKVVWIVFIALMTTSTLLIINDLLLRKFWIGLRIPFNYFQNLSLSSSIRQRVDNFFSEIFKFSLLIIFLLNFVFLFYSFRMSSLALTDLIKLAGKNFLVMIIIATALEITLNKRKLLTSLRMDDQELRSEQKEQERDPLLSAQQKSEYRMLSLEYLEAEVKASKVIFINKY